MNIKEKFNNAKAWTAEKAGQAKEWCKDHKDEIIAYFIGIGAGIGCYEIGRLAERQDTLDIRDQALMYKQKYEDEYNLVETAYNSGLREGRLEGKLESIDIVLSSATSEDK